MVRAAPAIVIMNVLLFAALIVANEVGERRPDPYANAFTASKPLLALAFFSTWGLAGLSTALTISTLKRRQQVYVLAWLVLSGLYIAWVLVNVSFFVFH